MMQRVDPRKCATKFGRHFAEPRQGFKITNAKISRVTQRIEMGCDAKDPLAIRQSTWLITTAAGRGQHTHVVWLVDIAQRVMTCVQWRKSNFRCARYYCYLTRLSCLGVYGKASCHVRWLHDNSLSLTRSHNQKLRKRRNGPDRFQTASHVIQRVNRQRHRFQQGAFGFNADGVPRTVDLPPLALNASRIRKRVNGFIIGLQCAALGQCHFQDGLDRALRAARHIVGPAEAWLRYGCLDIHVAMTAVEPHQQPFLLSLRGDHDAKTVACRIAPVQRRSITPQPLDIRKR